MAESSGASRWRHLPNILTLARLLLALPIAFTVAWGHFSSGLILAILAGASDALDGFLARRFHWQSRLGAILDPLADKLLLIGCFMALSWVGAVPLTLTLIVLARDVLIVGGVLLWRWKIGVLHVQPSMLSKLNTTAQILYVLVVLALLATQRSLSLVGPDWAVAALTIASGVDYILRWGWRARRDLRIRRRNHGI